MTGPKLNAVGAPLPDPNTPRVLTDAMTAPTTDPPVQFAHARLVPGASEHPAEIEPQPRAVHVTVVDAPDGETVRITVTDAEGNLIEGVTQDSVDGGFHLAIPVPDSGDPEHVPPYVWKLLEALLSDASMLDFAGKPVPYQVRRRLADHAASNGLTHPGR